MAEREMRVMFRCSFGLPIRQIADEERGTVGPLMRETFEAWRDMGVKLLGCFGSHGDGFDGFSHNLILAVDEMEQVHAMDRYITSGELGKYIEKFGFEIGWSLPMMEEIWEE